MTKLFLSRSTQLLQEFYSYFEKLANSTEKKLFYQIFKFKKNSYNIS